MAEETKVKITGEERKKTEEALKMFEAYDNMRNIEAQIEIIEFEIENSIPKKFDVCKLPQLLLLLQKILTMLLDIQSTITTVISTLLSNPVANLSKAAGAASNMAKTKAENKVKDKAEEKSNKNKEEKTDDNKEGSSDQEPKIDADYLKYFATQIIMKMFQILKYYMESIKLGLQIKIANFTKRGLNCLLKNKGSAADPNNAIMTNGMTNTIATVNIIIAIIDAIVTMLNNVNILNVNGAGMAFFPTPKSIMKVDINIENSRQSTTNNIPEAIDKQITKIENKIKESNGEIKKAKIISMGAAGATTATSGNFDPGSFGQLQKIDPAMIRTAINMLLQSLTDADALPPYEKLSIINPRFLVFLLTGFEPAGKKTFGIPGFP